MPEYAMVTVRKGDFGRKYKLVQEGQARNRVMNPRKLRSIAQNWPDASKDTVTLILDTGEAGKPDATYLIADGQHRIAAASNFFDAPINIRAMVWHRNEVSDLAAFITAFNRGTAFSTANLLQVFIERSRWPELAEGRDLNISMSRFRHMKFSWTAIMRGVALADHWRDNAPFGMKPRGREELTYRYWVDYPQESIAEVLDALEWWKPIAETMYSGAARSGKLYSDVALAIAISVYRKYQRRPAFLRDARERFMASNQFSVLHVQDIKQTRWFARTILAGFNHRASKNFVELYGETGRD